VINPNDILVEDRMRKDYGDVAELASSIKENGLIQPIVLSMINVDFGLSPDGLGYKLVAGGRRLAALKLLKWPQLEHGVHFIVRGEDESTPEGKLRLGAIELEENLRRKEMTWPEQVEGKQRLLELMQSIHGGSRGAGAPSGREIAAGETSGFGVRKLAAMLGESPALISKDLQLATLVRAMPQLAKQESKSSASRIGTVQLALHHIKMQQAKVTVAQATGGSSCVAQFHEDDSPKYDLFQGDWKKSIHTIDDEEIDLIYTDLPYGVDLDKMGATENVSAHGGAISYSDDRHTIVDSLQNLAKESYRALKNHRFGVFFFGFNYYSELCGALLDTGFTINPIPVVWLKHQQFTQQPTHRYANGYEQAIIAMKGQPTFIHPGRVNIVDCPGISTAQRMQVAQQPTELVKRFILDMTLPRSGAKVLDFYSGTGTTGVAALELGQYPILFEKDPDQCSIIQNRLEQALKQQSTSSKK
jgi:DNA modification methylase/ParB-like chromosome segregation protein Spo0J